RRQPAEQTERVIWSQIESTQRRFHVPYRLGDDLDSYRISLVGMFENLRGKAAKIARLCVCGEFDHIFRVAAKYRHHLPRERRSRPHAVMGKQGLLQKIAPYARAATLVADLEAPAANSARAPFTAHHIGGTCAEDRHGRSEERRVGKGGRLTYGAD